MHRRTCLEPTVRAARGLLMLSFVSAWAHMARADELQRPEHGKKIKVFILAGQSNMEGRADGDKLTAQDRERLRKAQGRVQLAFNEEPIRALDVVEPSAEIVKFYRRYVIYGPELFFGVTLSEAWPEEKILLIKRTAGGSSLHGC